MERHLMDRDRDGQLYLEARRQQAVQDLLGNRSSFLSTITPPSTNPSSAASSLFHEPLSSNTIGNNDDANNNNTSSSSTAPTLVALATPITPTSPSSPFTPFTPATNMSSTLASVTIPPSAITATTTFRTLASPIGNIVPITKKTRLRSASASASVSAPAPTTKGRAFAPKEADRPIFTISPSSFEYQLTASLLKYQPQSPTTTPAATTTSSAEGKRHRSRSRSKPRQQKSRRGTVNSDGRIESYPVPAPVPDSNRSTGHRHNRSLAETTSSSKKLVPKTFEACQQSHARAAGADDLIAQASAPSSTATTGQQKQLEQSTTSLPPTPPSPPLPPLPPKSPRSLIAHYFPGSLPPPPSRERAPVGHRAPLVAPTPFKTPTFGPALMLSSAQDGHAPPLPSPSASLHYIPSSATISRCSTAHTHHPHEDMEALSPSNRASPCTSALGFRVSTTNRGQQQDMSLSHGNSSRGRFHNQHASHNNTPFCYRNHPANNFTIYSESNHKDKLKDEDHNSAAGVSAEEVSVTIFPSTSDVDTRHISSHASIITSTTTPIYPRGLMPSSTSPLTSLNTSVVIRVQQKPAPYVRELVPGREDNPDLAGKPSGISSTNTSRDLEIVLEEITGRIRTNRTSFDPWPLHVSPLETKPLPPIRREKGDRYWIFRDQEGIVPGPFFFLLGHLCPILWWIGSIYPSIEHPDNLTASERAHAGSDDDVEAQTSDLREHPMVQWLQRQLKAAGARIASIKTTSKDESATVATLQIVRISQETDREGSTLVLGGNNNISTIHIPMPSFREFDRHGPWSAEDHASSLFELRMEHNRKVLRYELDLRWKRINLIWSIGSFVLAICITAFVIGFA
ncbi:hypothetical protein BGZ54_008057 [Gamsiella multidivaricata]|nr:hypothetical protein BGZ54_008057 [Gamsiella multidivaricata]